MNKITVSAPGKLMLFGEHAVVYGRPCIVTAVGQRMKVTVELSNDPFFELKAPDVSVEGYKKQMIDLSIGEIPKGAKFVEIAMYNFYNCYKSYTKNTGIRITTKSQFSSQFGFGSSSASTVCVIKALSELMGVKLTNMEIFKLAYKTVLDIQGVASGFDVAAATFGGTLYYVIGGKILKPLNLPSLPLIVGYSGIKADTVTLVNFVKEKAKKYPKVIDDIYTSIEDLVNLAKKALLKGDFQTVGELMNFNQGYLSSLGVSNDKLEAMIYAARNAGAYGAKLSGAGGGDCMIALAPTKSKKAVEQAINKASLPLRGKAGGQHIDIKTNVEGVRIEKYGK